MGGIVYSGKRMCILYIHIMYTLCLAKQQQQTHFLSRDLLTSYSIRLSHEGTSSPGIGKGMDLNMTTRQFYVAFRYVVYIYIYNAIFIILYFVGTGSLHP